MMRSIDDDEIQIIEPRQGIPVMSAAAAARAADNLNAFFSASTIPVNGINRGSTPQSLMRGSQQHKWAPVTSVNSQPRLIVHTPAPPRPLPPKIDKPIIEKPAPARIPLPFPCFECSQAFSDEDLREQHRLEQHRDHYVVGICLLCGRKCRDKFAYRDHFSKDHHYQFHRLLFHVAQKKGTMPDQITSQIWILSSKFKRINEDNDLESMLSAVDLAIASRTESKEQQPQSDPVPDPNLYVTSPPEILPRPPGQQLSPFSIKDELEEPLDSDYMTQQPSTANAPITTPPLFGAMALDEIKMENVDMMDMQMMSEEQFHQIALMQSSFDRKFAPSGPPRKKRKYTTRSGVWAHFVDGPDKKATCSECGREIARPNSGTSAMLTHLKELHPARYEEAMEHARIKGSLNKGPGRPPGSTNSPKKLNECLEPVLSSLRSSETTPAEPQQEQPPLFENV